MSRRDVIATLGVAGALKISLPGIGAAWALPGNPDELDFADPLVSFRARMRLQFSLEAEDVPRWHLSTIFGVRPGETPQPLFHTEGMEISYVTPLGNDRYRITTRTLTFFRDLNSWDLLEHWQNPYTGKRNTVEPNQIEFLDGVVFSPDGISFYNDKVLPLGDSAQLFHWRVAEPWLYMFKGTEFAGPMAEGAHFSCTLDDFLQADATNVPAQFTITYIAPWPAWMNMTDEAGHVVWHATGHKLKTVDDLPDSYSDLALAGYSHMLTAKPTES
ncbi:MAG: DUF1838 domain-containing protein [Gammaproteobacteria bacterium]|nr:DUF1838 domain-containing protein [Gammaproteobacteria bacterium]